MLRGLVASSPRIELDRSELVILRRPERRSGTTANASSIAVDNTALVFG